MPVNTMYDKYGSIIKQDTILYNPFYGEYWTVIEDNNKLMAKHLANNYVTDLVNVINSFIVVKNYIQKR